MIGRFTAGSAGIGAAVFFGMPIKLLLRSKDRCWGPDQLTIAFPACYHILIKYAKFCLVTAEEKPFIKYGDSLMTKEYKEKYNTRVRSFIDDDPDLHAARKLLFVGLCIFLGSRFAYCIIETIVVFVRNLPITGCFFNYAGLIMGLFFALGIYKFGFRALALAAMLGGIGSILFQVSSDDFVYNLQNSDTIYKVYVFGLIVTMLVQTFVMLIFLVNKKCNKYFVEVRKKCKEIEEELNNMSPRRL